MTLLLTFVNENQSALPPQFKSLLNPEYQKSLHSATAQIQTESELEQLNFFSLSKNDQQKAISMINKMEAKDLSPTDVAKILKEEFVK